MKKSEVENEIGKEEKLVPVVDNFDSLIHSVKIRKRFEDMLGKKSAGFISSVVSAVNLNPELKIADPMTVISAAAIAASLDLPINPNLGFAAIVPYKIKGGISKAQFQMMAKGFVQLAMRSGQYLTLNYTQVYEGELVSQNRFTGDFHFDSEKRKSDKVIGYVAYEKLINGFEKYFYMSVEEVMAHGKRYSKAYETGLWREVNLGNHAMPLKTVIKLLLSKWGVLSIEMQNAIKYDQAVISNIDENEPVPEYIDNPENVEVEEKEKIKTTTSFSDPITVDNPNNVEINIFDDNDFINRVNKLLDNIPIDAFKAMMRRYGIKELTDLKTVSAQENFIKELKKLM